MYLRAPVLASHGPAALKWGYSLGWFCLVCHFSFIVRRGPRKKEKAGGAPFSQHVPNRCCRVCNASLLLRTYDGWGTAVASVPILGGETIFSECRSSLRTALLPFFGTNYLELESTCSQNWTAVLNGLPNINTILSLEPCVWRFIFVGYLSVGHRSGCTFLLSQSQPFGVSY